MIIDAHVHMLTEPGYEEKIIKEARRLKIDRICLLAGHPEVEIWGSHMAPNERVLKAYEKFPEMVIPFGFFDLGADSSEIVDELFSAGFKGIKFTRARKNYDDKSFYPVYQKMESHRMVALFHTGTVPRTPVDREHDVNSDWFRETLWWFPETMARLAPDKDITFYQNAEDQAHPFDRIVFGTDVPVPEMAQAQKEYRQMLEALDVADPVCMRVWGKNLLNMLGEES